MTDWNSSDWKTPPADRSIRDDATKKEAMPVPNSEALIASFKERVNAGAHQPR